MIANNSIASKAYFEKHECPICFQELSAKPTACFCDRTGKQVCSHHCHADCARSISRPAHCPICSKPFADIQPIPSLNVDVRAWFDHIDKDHSGYLHYQEIIDGLKEQVDLDWQRVESDVDRLWATWDKDRNGKVSFEEFAHPTTGVAAYLSKHYRPTPRADPPDITKDKGAWFRYWDEDNSGSLDKDEVLRALIKTFRAYHISHDTIREIVSVIWPIFDVDGSGKIDMHEFCAPDNLGDTLVAQLGFGMRHGK